MKNKKILSLILIIVTALTLMTSCSSSENAGNDIEAPEGTVGVTNDAIHFTVCYPQNWVCDRNDGLVSISPPGDSESKATISVHESSALSEAITPEDYWDKAKEELETSGNKCNFLDGKERTLGGEKAWQVTYVIEVGGNSYKVTQVFAYKSMDKSHRVFTVTFTGTEDDYGNKDIASAFNTIMNTFAFKAEA
ncbi:MAG: hypothetical protein E7614_07885 [Ruminococcaceae bacterium]|nr:hypothetical protein [Oscillospiraceae bacterium]